MSEHLGLNHSYGLLLQSIFVLFDALAQSFSCMDFQSIDKDDERILYKYLHLCTEDKIRLISLIDLEQLEG